MGNRRNPTDGVMRIDCFAPKSALGLFFFGILKFQTALPRKSALGLFLGILKFH